MLITPQRLVSIWARKSCSVKSSNRVHVRVACVVDENVEPPEGVDCLPDRAFGLGAIGHVHLNRTGAIRKPLDQVAERLGVTGGGHEPVARI
jgi:hypothetical protein